MHTLGPVEFVWDQAKAIANLRKHGVDFADAVLVFEDEFALTLSDPHSEGEERFVTLGQDPSSRLLVVVYSWRAERIRIISARPATGNERRRYEMDP
jgi:uncharacterized protein